MPSTDEIFEKVKYCMVEALGVEDEEVTMEASITADLGGESIDFLDIVFRLEKTFSIKIPRGELFPEKILTNEAFFVEGKMTSDGLIELKNRMPHADLTEFEKNPEIKDIGNLFTVGMIVKYVDTKLNASAVAS